MSDIALSIESQPIKNGTVVSGCLSTGLFNKLDTSVSNVPSIETIATKYADRFDDVNYYMGGGGSINGGTYTGNDINGGEA
jgi:hypothetical protein